MLGRREDPTPFPEGTRVVETPFCKRGVVSKPTSFGCSILLDEPTHTDRVHKSWDEVHRESDYDIAEQQYYVDRAKEDVQRLQADLKAVQKRLEEAKGELLLERATLKQVKRRYS